MTTPTPDIDAMAIDIVGVFDGHPLDAHDKIVAILAKHLTPPTEPPAPKTAMERLPQELREAVTKIANALVRHGADRHYTKELTKALAQMILPYIERIEELEAIEKAAEFLVGVRAEFVRTTSYMPSHPGNEYWVDKFMGAYGHLEAARDAKANQEGGAA